jgi:hypothetical protein
MHHKLEKLPIYMKTSRNLYATIEPTEVEAVELKSEEIDDIIGEVAHQTVDTRICHFVPTEYRETYWSGLV